MLLSLMRRPKSIRWMLCSLHVCTEVRGLGFRVSYGLDNKSATFLYVRTFPLETQEFGKYMLTMRNGGPGSYTGEGITSKFDPATQEGQHDIQCKPQLLNHCLWHQELQSKPFSSGAQDGPQC